jgi:PAS domain S-box-containing protein
MRTVPNSLTSYATGSPAGMSGDGNQGLRALLTSSPLAFVVFDLDGDVECWNPAAESMFGWTEAEVVGRLYPLLQAGGPEQFGEIRDRILRDGDLRIPECRRPRRDGSLLDVSVSAGVVRDDAGAITGVLAIVADISDRKALEAERDQLFNESQQLLAVCGLNGAIRRVNDAWTRLLGHAPEDLIDRHFLDFVHPADRSGTLIHFEHLQHDMTTSFECRCLTSDGQYRWFLWRGTATKRQDRFYAYGTDITDRKTFEQELWEAHAETEHLLASIPSILIRLDARCHITRWNAAAETTFGLDSFTAIGRHFNACAKWSDARLTSDVFESDHPTCIEDLRFSGTDGKDHFVTLTVTPLQRSLGGTDGFLVLGSDVTEHKTLEEQLRQAQKLEAIGQLAAGIAHEINTPTQYVGDNARFLQDAFRGLDGLFSCVSQLRSAVTREEPVTTDQLQELDREAERADLDFLREEIPIAIGQSLEGVQRVTRIVRAMKEFSHPSEAKVATDLNRAIETTMIVAQNELKYVADTQTELDPQLPLVPCLPGEVNQVILNLLINAAHAIADVVGEGCGKGVITVSTSLVDDGVEIRVTDTGTGIPESARAHVFEPFFTTKQVGRGTGQGLSIAHAVIVKKHHGQIWFETATGQGTTFFVRLPLVAGSDPLC